MRDCFSDHAWIGSMLAVEAALARSESRFGIAPDGLGPGDRGDPAEDLDIAALGVRAAVAGVPTIPFVQAVQARLSADLERSFHKGATTQDIIDTALVLRIRDALELIAGRSGRDHPGIEPPGRPASHDPLRRTQLRAARRPDQLRLQGWPSG